MATRPIFIPILDGRLLYKELRVDFEWNPGFAVVQKKKNISAIHLAGREAGLTNILEVSTKSDSELGRRLSAFNLKYTLANGEGVPLECVYQGSKAFEHGGPFHDLYHAQPKDAKRDIRLKKSGNLVAFNLESEPFPTHPKHAFYDWIYIRCVYQHHLWLASKLSYDAFTDIEYNPAKSISCQARSCAILCALLARGQLGFAMKSPANFIQCLTGSATETLKSPKGTLFE